MKRLIIRLTVFATPLIILLLLLFGSAIYVGEAMSLYDVIRWQKSSEKPIFYSPEWQQDNIFDYKILYAEAVDPNVLVIGSSRVGSYRANLITHPDYSFYNAGVNGASFEQTVELFYVLNERGIEPDVVIFSVDIRGLIVSDVSEPYTIPTYPTVSEMINLQIIGTRRVARVWMGTNSMPVYLQNRSQSGIILLGLKAYQQQGGYLNDGAWYRFDETNHQREEVMRKQFTQFSTSNDLSFNQTRFQSIENFLATINTSETVFIGVLHPYHPDYEPSFSPHVKEIKQRLIDMFAEYNVALFDFHDIESFDGEIIDMLDLTHFGERAATMMYLDMVEAMPDILGKYSDVTILQTMIDDADNPIHIFPINP